MEVVVKVTVRAVQVPVEVPTFTRWKLQSKKWFIDPADPPPTRADKFQECYYDRLTRKIPDQVKFEKKLIDFGDVEKAKTQTLRFPFKNTSSQEVTVEKVYVQEPFMRDRTVKTGIRPGETGEVVVELDTSSFHLLYDQSIFVNFQPIKECNRLRMRGTILTTEELNKRKQNSMRTKGPAEGKDAGKDK